jgi:FkbM family methyltransferase
MKIRKLLSNIKHHLFHKKEQWDIVEVNGKSIKCLKNSYRKTKDSDDDWFNNLSKNSTIIFDIGCNIGYTALLGLTNENVKKILLVDPNPQALIIAHKNLIQNNLIGKTSTFVSFVSDANDNEIDFYTIGHGAAGSIYKSHAETAASLNSFIKVKTVTLDFLSTYFNLAPDFVKIDVEGAEFQVLVGAKETVLKNKPKILVEMHSNKELTMFENTNNVLKWCHEVEYDTWYLTNKELLTTPETVKKRGKCHFLLLPKGQLFPNYLN